MSVPKRSLTWVASVAALLIMGYWLAKPMPHAGAAATIPPSMAVAPAVDAAASGKTFTVRIAAPGAQQEQPVFQITENDDITIRVLSEQTGTVMLHGLTDSVVVARNGEALVHFKAIHTGRFPLHLHGESGSHVELAVMEILPR